MTEDVKKQKVSRKTILPFVEKIVTLTKQMSVIVGSMPDSSAKTSYITSLRNLVKKNEGYSSGPVSMTDEETELLKNFREGKIKITPIEAETNEVSAVSNMEPKKARGKK